MKIELLKNIHEAFKTQWGTLTESKINRIIKGGEDPKWMEILGFFQHDDVFDYSYIQSPSLALFTPQLIPNNEIGFFLYIHLEAPVFTCFFKKTHFGFSAKNTRYTISSTSPDKKFNFTLDSVMSHVKNTYSGYQYVPIICYLKKELIGDSLWGAMKKWKGISSLSTSLILSLSVKGMKW